MPGGGAYSFRLSVAEDPVIVVEAGHDFFADAGQVGDIVRGQGVQEQ